MTYFILYGIHLVIFFLKTTIVGHKLITQIILVRDLPGSNGKRELPHHLHYKKYIYIKKLNRVLPHFHGASGCMCKSYAPGC